MDDDRRSVAGLSDLSETDRVLFTVLSNPEHVDLSSLPKVPATNLRYEDDGPRIEELPPIPEEEPPPDGGIDLAPPRPSTPPRHIPSAPSPPPLEAAAAAASFPMPGDDGGEPSAGADAPESTAPHPDPPLPESEDDEMTKRTLLLDLRRLEMQGVRLTKEFTMDDRADDMLLELRRHTLAMDETANVNMMRDALRLFCTGVEMVNNRIGLLDLEGWSSEVCRDLHKYDPNLSRIYRKYWRRSTTTSPEVDICLSLVGSMGLHHMKRKMSQQLMAGASSGGGGFRGGGFAGRRGGGGGASSSDATRRPQTPPSSDDEEGLPP